MNLFIDLFHSFISLYSGLLHRHWDKRKIYGTRKMTTKDVGWPWAIHFNMVIFHLYADSWKLPYSSGSLHCQWASYQIRKIAGCACAGNVGNVSPRRRFQRKPIVGDPGMHHGTCVTHVPWCMSGSLTCGDGEHVPGIPGACAPAILRIWQEAHGEIVWLHMAT